VTAATDPGAGPPAEPPRTGLGRWWTLQTGYWLVRAAAFVVIGALTLARPSAAGHRAFEVTVLVLIGVFMVLWGVADRQIRRRQPWHRLLWPLVVTLSGLGVVGGLGAALSPARSVTSFAAMAALGAGSELSFAPACAVTTVGIVGVETSGVLFGFSTSTAIGLPLVLIVSLLAGRTRREGRLRADQAAAVVTQLRQAQSEQQRAAALDERNRIAREIHDVLAHSLSALGIQIEAAQAVLNESGDVATANRLLGRAHHLANDGLEETRRAIHALRTDTPPLPDSLATMVGHYREQHRQPIDFSVTGPARPLPPDANLALIRTAQEALTNAARHAPGTAVTVRLGYGPQVTILTVTNAVTDYERPTSAGDGPGGHRAGGGNGLAGMRERLLLIDGTLTAGHSDGRWTVEARIPL
jgi:signal transduction histidine kinase